MDSKTPSSILEELAQRSTVQTEAALVGGQRVWLRSGFDLQIIEPTRERRLPVCYTHMTLGHPGGAKTNDIYVEQVGIANRQAIFKLIQECLYFSNIAPETPSFVNGQESTFRQLFDGDEVLIGAVKIRVIQLKEAAAFLECYSDPHRQQHWTVGPMSCRIGRIGKRANEVELLDETVSRQHATIERVDSAYVLRVEDGQSSTWVNGDQVADHRILQNEDLLQLGQQLLRFRTFQTQLPARTLSSRVASILFSDIWNYSSFSESRPLEQVIGQVNEMYKGLGKVAAANQGQLMTYLGDAMMVLFDSDNLDDFAIKAVSAALGMNERLQELNADWAQRGYPQLQMGIGIATGEVMVGDVGATEHREFAAMGDTTNVAARIEKLTRETEAHILVCHTTAELVYSRFRLESLGETELRGRRKTVGLYSVLGEL